eukprot:213199-Alexandrium_andersonii.AAC.1
MGSPLFLDRRYLVEDRSVFEKTARYTLQYLSFCRPQRSCVWPLRSFARPQMSCAGPHMSYC